jgi:hypothetical protein
MVQVRKFRRMPAKNPQANSESAIENLETFGMRRFGYAVDGTTVAPFETRHHGVSSSCPFRRADVGHGAERQFAVLDVVLPAREQGLGVPASGCNDLTAGDGRGQLPDRFSEPHDIGA